MNGEFGKFFKSLAKFALYATFFYMGLIIIVSFVPVGFLKQNINYRIGSYGHMFTRIREIKRYKNVDILFLGSSHAYRGFDTRIFKRYNLNTFNLGSSSQTPIQTEVLLKRYFGLLNPKLVIIEISPMIMESDGVEASLDLIANDRKDLYLFTKLIRWNNIKTINTAIVALFHEVFNLDKNFVENIQKDDDTYIHGGFVEKKMSFYSPQKFEKHEIKINKQQIAALQSCIKFIKSKHVNYVLVQAPVTKALYLSYTNSHEFDSVISRLGNYFNFNNLLSLDDSLHFYDAHHLNQDGVKIFNKALIKILKSKGLLKY